MIVGLKFAEQCCSWFHGCCDISAVLLTQISFASEPACATLCLVLMVVVAEKGKPSENDVVAVNVLSSLFHSCDLRSQTAIGLWPSLELRQDPLRLANALTVPRSILVADTYGGVEAVRWARDAYNARQIIWLTNSNSNGYVVMFLLKQYFCSVLSPFQFFGGVLK